MITFGALAQRHYITNEVNASIQFGYKDRLPIARSETVDILFDRRKIVIWITIKGSNFETGNNRIDRRLFRKNRNEFVLKVDLKNEDVINPNGDLIRFSMIGRVFNKEDGAPVNITGAIGESQNGIKENFYLIVYFGVETRWLGSRFSKYTDYPVFNLQIAADLIPFDGD